MDKMSRLQLKLYNSNMKFHHSITHILCSPDDVGITDGTLNEAERRGKTTFREAGEGYERGEWPAAECSTVVTCYSTINTFSAHLMCFEFVVGSLMTPLLYYYVKTF